MTVRNLEHLFAPGSVALVGAGAQPGSVGRKITDNLLRGGFTGPVWLVNPRGGRIAGETVYRRIEDLPEAPELAVVATPPATVAGVIEELAAKGTRAVVVITAGIDRRTRQAILDASRPTCLRIVGPNSLGVWVPRLGLDASFGHIKPQPGPLAFLSQSGALASAVLDWAASRHIGFSAVVSMGDMADVDVGDLLDFFAADISTRAILLYLETVPTARKFMSAARSAARAKPVVVVKAGRSSAAARAAATHTGALAGADDVADAAFRRAGLLRVHELEELFTAAETLTRVSPIHGNSLAILTNGGGAGVLAIDHLDACGGTLAPLGEQAMQRLDAVLPKTWSRANPVDIIGDATPERYRAALEILLEDSDASAIVVINCPTALISSTAAAEAVIDVVEQRRLDGAVPPVLCNWLGGEGTVDARRKFAAADIPSYESPADAVRGFKYLWQHTRLQESLAQVPPSEPEISDIDSDRGRAALEAAQQEDRALLTEPESKALLAAYGIPTVPTKIAVDVEEVERIATELLADTGAVVVKILSRDISHKSDVGGVRLGLASAAEAAAAAADMLANIPRAMPDARLEGVTVQPMIRRPRAHELIVGLSEDPLFGPTILFGAGGTSAEVVKDRAVGLPPLDAKLARDLIEETRIYRLMRGYRDRPAADLDAIVETLMRVSQLVIDIPALRELDINPLLADEAGVIALDARVLIAPQDVDEHGPNPRLTIRPYPSRWEAWRETLHGQRVFLRPIRPSDERLYGEFFDNLSPEDIRFRFLAPKRQFSHRMIARFTQIDYARAMAFVALDESGDRLLGVARLIADPDYTEAEYAIIVRSDLKGRGLGWVLMEHLIAYAEAEGLQQLYGDVLRANTGMIQMCREFGFRITANPDDPSLYRVILPIAEAGARLRAR